MGRAFVLIVIVMSAACISAPAAGQYLIWSENFDGYDCNLNGGNLAGQGGWTLPTVTGYISPKLKHDEQYMSPHHAVRQPAGTKSLVYKDMRPLNTGNKTFREGLILAWVWDPKTTAGQATRFGVNSTVSQSGAGGAMFGLGIETAQTNSHWAAVWMTWLKLDGSMVGATGTGYTWTNGAAAPRVAGWSYAFIYWNYPLDVNGRLAGTCHVDFYVNQTDNANAVLDFTTASTRWAGGTPNISHVLLGDTGASANAGYIDNIELYTYFPPEPSGLVTLGAGLVTLTGFLRRRKS